MNSFLDVIVTIDSSSVLKFTYSFEYFHEKIFFHAGQTATNISIGAKFIIPEYPRQLIITKITKTSWNVFIETKSIPNLN